MARNQTNKCEPGDWCQLCVHCARYELVEDEEGEDQVAVSCDLNAICPHYQNRWTAQGERGDEG